MFVLDFVAFGRMVRMAYDVDVIVVGGGLVGLVVMCELVVVGWWVILVD